MFRRGVVEWHRHRLGRVGVMGPAASAGADHPGEQPITSHDRRTFTEPNWPAGGSRASSPRRAISTSGAPLVTPARRRPWASGGRSILGPPSRSASNSTEPHLDDQRTDLRRVLGDRRPRPPSRSADALPRMPKVLRDNDFKGHGGDRRRRRSSTSRAAPRPHCAMGSRSTSGRRPWSRPLLDLSTGTPVRGRVDAQPAAAVRRRRHHPDQRDDDGPGRPAGSSEPPHRRFAELCRPGARGGGVAATNVYGVAIAGNATMTPSCSASTRSRSGSRRSS